MPSKFFELNLLILKAVNSGVLRIVHNNQLDQWYSAQYLGKCMKTFPVIQSLCESPLRFRIDVPLATGKPFLIWDTRGHITGNTSSKALLKIYERLGDFCDVTSILSAKSKSFLDDTMLEKYQAIIHIPYNISTMSCFEQSAAGIPIWVPTSDFLQEILLNEEKNNELSWFCFNKQLQENASFPDQVWKPECVKEYVERADFYNGALNTVFTFSSVEDLAARISTESYKAATERAFVLQGKKRLEVLGQYSKILGLTTSEETPSL